MSFLKKVAGKAVKLVKFVVGFICLTSILLIALVGAKVVEVHMGWIPKYIVTIIQVSTPMVDMKGDANEVNIGGGGGSPEKSRPSEEDPDAWGYGKVEKDPLY